MFNFEKLEAWQRAIDFACAVCETTREFPTDERFGLTNQLRRAAVSVSSNLAEDSSRTSHADSSRFVEIETGSLFEVVSQTHIAKRQGSFDTDTFHDIYRRSEELNRMLSGLRKYLADSKS